MGDNYGYAIRGAVITAVTLFGGIIAGFVFVEVISSFAPVTDFEDLPVGIVLVVMAMHISGPVVGGAIWGVAMGRLAGIPDRRRFARAGLLGFVPVTAVMMIGLGILEQVILGTNNQHSVPLAVADDRAPVDSGALAVFGLLTLAIVAIAGYWWRTRR